MPSRPTTDGKPKEVPEKWSNEETGSTRSSSLKMQFRMSTTQVAIP